MGRYSRTLNSPVARGLLKIGLLLSIIALMVVYHPGLFPRDSAFYTDDAATTIAMHGRDVADTTPYNADVSCPLGFAPGHSLPLVALASSPGSGNTWLRHLIEQATGIFSGTTIECSQLLLEAGFLGDCVDYFSGTTIVGKVHKPRKAKLFDAVILVYRNPYKALLAEFNRRQAGKTGFAEEETFKDKAWRTFVPVVSSGWETKTSKWLLTKKPLLAIRYEDVKADTLREVEKIVTFLNVTMDDARRECVLHNREGAFHRLDNASKAMTFDPFTETMHLNIDKKIARVNKILSQRGLKPVGTEPYMST